jgi:hypothetical protein
LDENPEHQASTPVRYQHRCQAQQETASHQTHHLYRHQVAPRGGEALAAVPAASLAPAQAEDQAQEAQPGQRGETDEPERPAAEEETTEQEEAQEQGKA